MLYLPPSTGAITNYVDPLGLGGNLPPGANTSALSASSSYLPPSASHSRHAGSHVARAHHARTSHPRVHHPRVRKAPGQPRVHTIPDLYLEHQPF